MDTADKILSLDINQRSKLILEEVGDLTGEDDDIVAAQRISAVLNTFLPDYFKLRIENETQKGSGSILAEDNLEKAIKQEIRLFMPDAISSVKNKDSREDILSNSKNLYEISGAVNLAAANKITRSLSTTMGHLWERIALISPYAISPELEFNIKIKGIDLIILNCRTQVIEYLQLKTMKDTLTGSQKSRSVKELMIHDNPVFCACFTTSSGWTFNHVTIPRVHGEEFWSRIGIPYEIVLSNVKKLILELEKEYIASV